MVRDVANEALVAAHVADSCAYNFVVSVGFLQMQHLKFERQTNFVQVTVSAGTRTVRSKLLILTPVSAMRRVILQILP